MADTYKHGGILQVLHSSNTGEDEEERNCDTLVDLFTTTVTEEADNQIVVDSKTNDAIIDSNADIKDQGVVKANIKKKKKQKESPERLERTLFIGNVSINVTRKTLKKLFVKFGEIESLRFRSFTGADVKVPKKVAIITKTFHSECKSMNAYVVYKDKESIGKALTCNGMVLEGLHLRVDKASPEKEHKNKQTLFVGNLPFNVNEEAVYQHFAQCGEIDYVRLVRDKASGMGKGIGYVTFKKTDGIMFGLKLNGTKLNGRALRVNRSENSPKNQFNNQSRKKNQQFCGLKSTTSEKDRVKGRKFVQEKIRTSSNAMRRIKNKVGTKRKIKNGKNSVKMSRKR